MTFQALVAFVVSSSMGSASLSGELALPRIAAVAPEVVDTAVVEKKSVEEDTLQVLNSISAYLKPQIHLKDWSGSRLVKEYDPTLSVEISRGEIQGFNSTLQLSFRL